MRLREPGGRLCDAEVAIMRVSAKTVRDKIHGAQLGRLDQFGMRDGDGKQGALELPFPKGEEILQRRKVWKQVIVLPDVGLQQPVTIRPTVHDFRRRQTIAKDLLAKALGNF